MKIIAIVAAMYGCMVLVACGEPEVAQPCTAADENEKVAQPCTAAEDADTVALTCTDAVKVVVADTAWNDTIINY